MGSNHMHEIFRNLKNNDPYPKMGEIKKIDTTKKVDKKKIPTHDPQTGELNPYYEELTGEKNPLDIKTKKNNIETFNEVLKETIDNVRILKKELRDLEESMKRVYKKRL
jgi:hypothetical protein